MGQVLHHGKEIYIFFRKYEILGIIGIFISSLTISILILKILKIIIKNDIKDYNHFVSFVFEDINPKEKITQIIYLIINIFLLVSFYIMMAGFTSYFKEKYNISTYISSIICAFFCYIILKKNIKGIIKISTICVPIIITFIIVLGTKNINFATNQIIDMFYKINFRYSVNSIISALLYAGYNSILLIPVIINLKRYYNEKNIKIICFLVFSLIIILAVFVYIILLKGNLYIMQMDMPIAYIIKIFEKNYNLFYGIVIIISIVTSIISAAYSFLKNCSKDKVKYNRNLKIICFSSIFASNIGFSKLINILYPIFGLFGIIQIYFILLRKDE